MKANIRSHRSRGLKRRISPEGAEVPWEGKGRLQVGGCSTRLEVQGAIWAPKKWCSCSRALSLIACVPKNIFKILKSYPSKSVGCVAADAAEAVVWSWSKAIPTLLRVVSLWPRFDAERKKGGFCFPRLVEINNLVSPGSGRNFYLPDWVIQTLGRSQWVKEREKNVGRDEMEKADEMPVACFGLGESRNKGQLTSWSSSHQGQAGSTSVYFLKLPIVSLPKQRWLCLPHSLSWDDNKWPERGRTPHCPLFPCAQWNRSVKS